MTISQIGISSNNPPGGGGDERGARDAEQLQQVAPAKRVADETRQPPARNGVRCGTAKERKKKRLLPIPRPGLGRRCRGGIPRGCSVGLGRAGKGGAHTTPRANDALEIPHDR